MGGHLIVPGKVNIINSRCQFFSCQPYYWQWNCVIMWLKCCAFGSVNKLWPCYVATLSSIRWRNLSPVTILAYLLLTVSTLNFIGWAYALTFWTTDYLNSESTKKPSLLKTDWLLFSCKTTLLNSILIPFPFDNFFFRSCWESGIYFFMKVHWLYSELHLECWKWRSTQW